MKVRFNRWYNAVLTALLGLLGYGCSSEESDMMAMYGTPHADFVVKGVVMDKANVPIQGIKTSLKTVFTEEAHAPYYVLGHDSIQTDASGCYELSYDELDTYYLKLIVEDIDGEANGGNFQSDTIDVDFDKAVKVKEGHGAWYGGVYELQQNIKLKKKE